MKTDAQLPFYAKASIILVGLFVFISMLHIAQSIIVPIIFSTILAIMLSPVVDFLVRKKINRILSITVSVTTLVSLAFLIIALMSSQIAQFSDSFPLFLIKFQSLADQSIAWISDHLNVSTQKINTWISEKTEMMLNGPGFNIGQTLITTGNILVIVLLIPVYTFMILFYQPLLLEFLRRLFRSNKQKEVGAVLTSTKGIIQSYLVGLLLEMGIISVMNSTTLLLIGIDYAILIGVMGAILNLIPYLGGMIAVTIPMIIALATKPTTTHCFLVLGGYILIQIIDNNYIIPKVVASKVKINALISIVVVLAGGALWGIPGMFLSIPLTAILKVIFDQIDPLKPWGYLLGNIVPTGPAFSFSRQKKYLLQKFTGKSSNKK